MLLALRSVDFVCEVEEGWAAEFLADLSPDKMIEFGLDPEASPMRHAASR